MSGPFDLSSTAAAAPVMVPSPAGPVAVRLPDRMSGQHWVKADTIGSGEHAAGYPAGVTPDVEIACRCGQTMVDTLRVRLGARSRVFCEACLALPNLVGAGAQVAFRLADSDLWPFVVGVDEEQGREIVLRGCVDLVLVGGHLVVFVEGWAVPHLVDVDDLVERPATMADMRRFWPDMEEDALKDAVAAIAIAWRRPDRGVRVRRRLRR